MADRDQRELSHAETDVASALAGPLARSLRDSRASVTYRWLERIKERVELPSGEVFPSEELLDHVPLLVAAIAEFVEDPSEEGTAADEVMVKAAELGQMRFDQGFSTYQVLKEFEILGGVVMSHLRAQITQLGFAPEPDDVVTVSHRVFRALAKVQQATAARHTALHDGRRHTLDQRLRLLDDMLGTMETLVPEAVRAGPDSAVARSLPGRMADLRQLAGTGPSSRQRGVPLRGVVKEAVRRVRPIAAEAEIDVSVDEPLAAIKVPDAQVEQCLVVYLTNALRHCRETGGHCEVEVSGHAEPDADRLVVRVRNTGDTVAAVDDITELSPDGGRPDGGGAGLRFARDIISAIGGSTWAEPASDPAGAIFALALPLRRDEDEVASAQGGE
jgi:signal transduction histidine kinase